MAGFAPSGRGAHTGAAGNATAAGLTLGRARVLWTGRPAGDLGRGTPGDRADESQVDAAARTDRRRAQVALPWAWLRQVHGAGVVTVMPGAPPAGADGDALVTNVREVALAVFTADCAPVAFAAAEGIVGIAHAGWRGLQAGVLEATARRMRELGASDVVAALGPCIHPCCYAFGQPDLDRLTAVWGNEVRGTTTLGQPALDLPRAVAAALDDASVALVADADACTGCDERWFSHRARGDVERQAGVVWMA